VVIVKSPSFAVALLLTGLFISPAGAGEAFDGRWKLEILELSGGMCSFARLSDLRIKGCEIDIAGHGLYLGRIVAAGEIDDEGTASIKGYLGAHYLITITGEFTATEARGRIDFFGRESCFGTWKAARLGQN
jgi:hypothetical protein